MRLFTPPEWPTWKLGDRVAYVVSLVLLLGVGALGALKLYEMLS